MVKHWLLAAATGMILAGPALGHAKLRSTIPAADAQLRVAPETLTLNFNEDVRLAVLTLTAGGKAMPVTLDRGAPAAAEVTIKLPVLPVGIYQVQWSALSIADGHVSKGTFSFTVLGPATARMASAPASAPIVAAPSTAAARPR